jgi:hypothetical protein
MENTKAPVPNALENLEGFLIAAFTVIGLIILMVAMFRDGLIEVLSVIHWQEIVCGLLLTAYSCTRYYSVAKADPKNSDAPTKAIVTQTLWLGLLFLVAYASLLHVIFW